MNPVTAGGGIRPPIITKPRVAAIGLPDPALGSGGAGGLGRPADRGDLLPTPGCDWEVEPTEFRVDQEWNKSDPKRLLVGVPTIEPRPGKLRIVVTQTTRSQGEAIPLRYVFFDAEGNRFPAQVSVRGYSNGGGGYVEFTHHEWDDMTPANPREIAYFGLERVKPDSVRLTAEAARAEAKRKRIDLLAPPRLGESFDFDLPTADGKRVRSADLKGKAILVVIFGPTPYGLTGLRQIRKEYKETELAVVAISFDATFEQTESARNSLGEPTRLVMIPNEPLTRRLWREGAEIDRIPAFWIVDPAGILRFQGHWFDLSDRLATTFGRPTRQQRIEAGMEEFRKKAKVEREAKQKAQAAETRTPPITVPTVVSPPTSPRVEAKDQRF